MDRQSYEVLVTSYLSLGQNEFHENQLPCRIGWGEEEREG